MQVCMTSCPLQEKAYQEILDVCGDDLSTLNYDQVQVTIATAYVYHFTIISLKI